MENKIELSVINMTFSLKLLYQNNQTEIPIIMTTNIHGFYTNPIDGNVSFKESNNHENLEISFLTRSMLGTIHIYVRKNDCVVFEPDGTTPIVIDDNNSINIPGYNSTLFISKTLRELISSFGNKEIYYDFFRNLFFINFLGMNLYFERYNKNYIIYTQEYVFYLDQNLNIFDTEYIIPSSGVGELSTGNLSNISQSNKKLLSRPSTPSTYKFSYGSPLSTNKTTVQPYGSQGTPISLIPSPWRNRGMRRTTGINDFVRNIHHSNNYQNRNL